MAKYTVELRWLIENGFDLGLQSYPIFDSNYRQTLNEKIIQYYYFREIGLETPALFKNRLNEKMNRIMPYYNKLYTALQGKYDPFINYQFTENTQRDLNRGKQTTTEEEKSGKDIMQGTDTKQGKSTTDGTSEYKDVTQSSQNSSNKTVGSDTPQGLLQAASINDATWASQAQMAAANQSDNGSITHTGTDGGTTTNSETIDKGSTVTRNDKSSGAGTEKEQVGENTDRTIKGFQGITFSQMLTEYREALFNVDQMIIDELEELFMGIW